MFSRFAVCLATLLLAFPALSAGTVAVRVNGADITREQIEYYYSRFLSYEMKGGEPDHEAETDKPPHNQAAYNNALKKYITNVLLRERAQKEIPKAVESMDRQVELILAADYKNAYLAEIATPEAEKQVTLETVLETIPPQEDGMSLFQISMERGQEAELGALRKRILAGEITFEEAARQYSTGLTAAKGGEVGGVKRSDDRYPKAVMDKLFSMKEGDISEVVELTLGPAILWVKDIVTAGELRQLAAQRELPIRVGARAVSLMWNDADGFAKKGKWEMILNEKTIEGVFEDASAVVFRAGGKGYTVSEILGSSGGRSSHGTKDLLTISENRFRDLALQKLYVERKGLLPLHELRRQVMTDHYVARQYIGYRTRDIEVTDADVDEYLAGHQEKYALSDRADLGVIIVRTEQRLQSVMDRLRAAEDFETVAKAWSQDQKTAQMGGRVGIVPFQVSEGGKAPAKGAILDPVPYEEDGEKGFIVVKVFEFFPAEPGTRGNLGESVVGGIRSIVLSQKKGGRLVALMSEVLKGANVEIVQ